MLNAKSTEHASGTTELVHAISLTLSGDFTQTSALHPDNALAMPAGALDLGITRQLAEETHYNGELVTVLAGQRVDSLMLARLVVDVTETMRQGNVQASSYGLRLFAARLFRAGFLVGADAKELAMLLRAPQRTRHGSLPRPPANAPCPGRTLPRSLKPTHAEVNPLHFRQNSLRKCLAEVTRTRFLAPHFR